MVNEDESNVNANETFNKSKLGHVTELQDYYDALDELEKQNGTLQNFDNEFTAGSPFNRWPTLFEILNKKTQSPLDLWSFYVYMRDEENAIDYLDFWIDTVQHINLCKAYVKDLRDSLIANSRIRQANRVTDVLNAKDNQDTSADNSGRFEDIDETRETAPAMQPPQTSFSMGGPSLSGNKRISNNSSNRNSHTSSRNSRSSSQLLDLLMKNDLFDGHDPHRLSMFLRGESAVRTSDPLVNAKIDELKRKSFINMNSTMNPRFDETEEQEVGNRKSIFRTSKINPEMVETFIQHDIDEKHRSFTEAHMITRSSLKKSSQLILNTYFRNDSDKKIGMPQEVIDRLKFGLEAQGRDDPEVFDEAREYVFKAMEFDAYPNFLRNHALKNVTKKSSAIRLILSMVCGLAAFWTGYTLIFLDYQPKPTRAVVVIPFFLMSYLFFSAFYRIDPILCFCGYAESMATAGRIIPLKEPYVRSILRKRSLFVLVVLCVVAAAFSVIFSLVPGHRLTH